MVTDVTCGRLWYEYLTCVNVNDCRTSGRWLSSWKVQHRDLPDWVSASLISSLTQNVCLCHSPGKHGKVREFQSGQEKVRGTEISFSIQLNYQWHKYCYQLNQLDISKYWHLLTNIGLFFINVKITVDHRIKQYINESACPTGKVKEKSGNLMCSGKWSPCHPLFF